MLFSPRDVRTRQQVDPEAMQHFNRDFEEFGNPQLDMATELDKYLAEPVMFITSLPEAQSNLARYKESFQKIPYLWSYFRVVEVLETQLQDYIENLDSSIESLPSVERLPPHPDAPRSQVQVQNPEVASDDPFGEFGDLLDSMGQDIFRADGPSDDQPVDASGILSAFSELEGVDEEKDDVGFSGLDDDDLLTAFAAADEFDRQSAQEMEEQEVAQERQRRRGRKEVAPIFTDFSSISWGGTGKKLRHVIELLDRLYHYAEREGGLTRVMQDILQDIFREGQTQWKITGQLAEDFIQGDPAYLSGIMIGRAGPSIITGVNFDLRYWSAGTLLKGDERLMYTLSTLPTEEIHNAYEANRFMQIAEYVPGLLVNTRSMRLPRLTEELLREAPEESNVWGIRVLVPQNRREYKAATLLCPDPRTTWHSYFNSQLNLPSVMHDWYAEFDLRFSQYTDRDSYKIYFKKARDIEATFESFARWVRRHNLMYQQKYGVNGTIMLLKKILLETTDKEEGQMIFNLLTTLTDYGFQAATNALSEEAVITRLSWLLT